MSSYIPQPWNASDPVVVTSAMQAYAQPIDSDLTAIAALSTTAYGRNLLTLANQAALQAAVVAAQTGTGSTFVMQDGPTITGQLIESGNGAASTPAVRLIGTWFSGGSATTTKPQLLVEPTGTTSAAWSTSGTGIGVNAATGFAGNLLDLQNAGTSRMTVSSNGSILSVGNITSSGQILSNRITTVAYNLNSAGANYGQIYVKDTTRWALGYGPSLSTIGSDSLCWGPTGIDVTGNVTASGTATLGIYTVATLPTASTNSYAEANVSDALAPTMGMTVVAGGAIKTKVRSNGTNWTVCGT